MSRPNILFIMTDQHRADALSCSGTYCQTPNLDRLVNEGGIRFSECITTSPICIPARFSMATGLYPHNTGVWDNADITLSPDTATWMQAVREAGYRTSLFGKTHLHPHRGDMRERVHLMHAYGLDDVNETVGPRATARTYCQMTEGWHQSGNWDAHAADYADRFANDPNIVRPSALPLEHYYDTYVGTTATDYLRTYNHDQPWCCWVSFGGPHEPWDTPEPYASRFSPDDMPLPLPRIEDTHEGPRGKLHQIFQRDRATKWNMSPERVAAMRADYAGSVALIDDQIGKIFDIITERNEWDNTIIVFTSDHGEMNGDHGLIYKNQFLDGALRVPLLVSTPATRQAGQAMTSPALVEWFDVGPTLAELAGAPPMQDQHARSLVPLLSDPTQAHRQAAFSEISRETVIVTHEWKAAFRSDGEGYLLIDRQADPDESRNLAGDPAHADTLGQLRDAVFRFNYETPNIA